jgi:hypothetical protein
MESKNLCRCFLRCETKTCLRQVFLAQLSLVCILNTHKRSLTEILQHELRTQFRGTSLALVCSVKFVWEKCTWVIYVGGFVELKALVEKTCELLTNRYGCPARFYNLNLDTGFVDAADTEEASLFGSAAVDEDFLDTLKKNSRARVLLIQGDLVFPYSEGSQILGFGLISGGANLDWDEMEDIQMLMDLIARSVIHGQKTSADRLHNELVKEASRSVVSIQDHPDFNGQEAIVVSNVKVQPDSHYLVEEQDPERVRRFAVDLNDRFGRQALVSIQDLSPDLFLSLREFFDLGGMTIYIPDLSALPLATQTVVEQYIAGQSSMSHTPLLVIGIRQSLKSLMDAQSVKTEFETLPMLSRIQLPSADRAKVDSSKIYKSLVANQESTRRKHLVAVPKAGMDLMNATMTSAEIH